MLNRNNIFNVLENFLLSGDGTYRIESVEYNTGYQVSFVRPEAFHQINAEQWNILTEYCCKYLNSDVHIGVYSGSTEVSFHVIDRLKAEETMDKFNQESILDWAKKCKYPENITHWLIMNQNYDENKSVDYHEILKQI